MSESIHHTRLAGIARRASKGAPMQSLEQARVSVEAGIEGDTRGRPGKRQVTVLCERHWRDACAQLGASLAWTERRANLLIDDIDWNADCVGKVLAIGTVRLLVTGETDPCRRMEALQPGLEAALAQNWRGGICCSVLSAGEIRLGDVVSWSDERGCDGLAQVDHTTAGA